ncbi:hypothetical protein D3C87_1932870 [compost metagenome]
MAPLAALVVFFENRRMIRLDSGAITRTPVARIGSSWNITTSAPITVRNSRV